MRMRDCGQPERLPESSYLESSVAPVAEQPRPPPDRRFDAALCELSPGLSDDDKLV
jgi:hypothetical protein